MKPIIKWRGGKSQEIKFFNDYLPKKINRYVEPFAGGRALFFYLENENSIINDVNFELISLYRLLHNKTDREFFIYNLEILNKQRDFINNFFIDYNEEQINKLFKTNLNKNSDIVFNNQLICFLENDKLFFKLVQDSVKDKIKRINIIQEKNNKIFDKKTLIEHLTTALQSALFFYSREIYNNGYNKQTSYTLKNFLPYYIANWYYVREFCYSSMFRFSKTGKFNVPYGGIGYNSKDFLSKINYLKDNKKLHNILEKSDIILSDFEDLFKKYNYFDKDDFIFLDPPYDSEFSQYNKGKDFDKNEQIRLRNELLKINCNIMVVIKETDFIYDLYKDKFNIIKFDKKYLVNMNNSNIKDVKHLIITNY